MTWVFDAPGVALRPHGEHVYLSVMPVVIGLDHRDPAGLGGQPLAACAGDLLTVAAASTASRRWR